MDALLTRNLPSFRSRPRPSPSPPASPYAVYISHAYTDRHTLALPLHRALQRSRISSFLSTADTPPITATTTATTITTTTATTTAVPLHLPAALDTAPIAVFLLSPDFLSREWPQRELSHVLARVRRDRRRGVSPPLIVPVFYKLSARCWRDEALFNAEDDLGRNIFLRDGFFDRPRDGFFNRVASTSALARQDEVRTALRELSKYRGVVNRALRAGAIVGDPAVVRADLVARTAAHVDKCVNDLGLLRREEADPEVVRAALTQGTDRLDTVRLMVLGGSTRGKTSTLASLRREPFVPDRESTRGVDLTVYFLVLGTAFDDEEARRTLAQKDRFQTKFYEYARRKRAPAAAPCGARQQNLRGGAPALSERSPSFSDRTGSVSTDLDSEMSRSSTEDPFAERVPSGEGVQESCKDKQKEGAGREAEVDARLAEDTAHSAIQLADDAMNSAEFHNIDVDGLTLRCWDFGGQREYEIAHELFISPRSILMLVFDLRRFEDEKTQDVEVRELSRWFQTLFAITAEEDVENTAESLLIVGTRRDSCKHPDRISDYFDLLKEKLVDVLDPGLTKSLKLFDIKCLAIENSKTRRNPQKSGLIALEEHLDVVAKRVIKRSKEVPLRWLAFLENIRNDDMLPGIYLTYDTIVDRMGGFHFPLSDIDRKKELKTMMLYFRDLGEVVLFDLSHLKLTASSENFVVFLHPDKILAALKVIVAPKKVRCIGLLGKRERERMSKGLMTPRVLEKKWRNLEGLSEQYDRNVLMELLVSMDLFVKLGEDTLGVPALLPMGWGDWGWMNGGSDRKEIAAVTKFQNYVPFGLIGRLIARMYRTIATEQTQVRYTRANAVLLTIGKDLSQLFMGFDNNARELHWKLRGDGYNFQLLGRCLTVFESHMRERVNTRLCGFKHYFVTDCPRGCNEMQFRLMFPIPCLTRTRESECEEAVEKWWDVKDLELSTVSSLCNVALCRNPNCANVYRYGDAMTISVPSESPGFVRKGIPDQYAVFVSHAGPDKKWAEYLAFALERKKIRTFVDRLELIASSETGDVLMNRAMQTARVGVFITSPEFFARKFPMEELRTFLKRNETENEDERAVIYPIFHRLSYHEVSSGELAEDERYAELLHSEGFFKEKRQQVCSTEDAMEAMRRLSRYPGLEKKLPDLHNSSFERHPWMYRARRVCRAVCNTVNGGLVYELEDRELGGCTTADLFDFAAERIAAEYHKKHEHREPS